MNVIGRLFRYVRFYKGKAITSAVLAVLVALLAVVRIPAIIPLFNALFDSDQTITQWPDRLPGFLAAWRQPLQDFINNWVLDHRFDMLIIAVGVILVLSLLKGVAQFFQGYTSGKVYTGVSRRIAADLYRHVLGLSMSFYSRVGTPSIVARFTNDVEAVGRGIKVLFGKAFLQPLMLAGFLVVAALINWKLLLLNVALFPVLGSIIYLLGRKARRATRKGLHSRDRLVNILQETLQGISIVKAFNMQRREEKRFEVENKRVLKQDLKLVKVSAMTSPLVEFVGAIGMSISLIVAGKWVTDGAMSAGDFMAFYGALASVFDPLRKLSGVNNQIQMLCAAGTRVFDYLDETTNIVEKDSAGHLGAFRDEIRFEKVFFTYDEMDTVLRGVDIVAHKGEIIAFVGPSGAGKTTMARLIPRFWDPTSGRVTIDGADLRDVTLSSLRNQIGLVTQEVILFNDTVASNIAYGKPDASAEEVIQAACAANADEFIRKLPEGYETVIGEKGHTLSGGQRQRIALARAILKDPPILILDEATSSLDSQSEHLIQQALDEFMLHRTSIVIAHRLSTVERASRIYVIEDGEIVAEGTNSQLLETSPLYKKLHNMQFHAVQTTTQDDGRE